MTFTYRNDNPANPAAAEINEVIQADSYEAADATFTERTGLDFWQQRNFSCQVTFK
jgi:hypothetical protein